MLLSWFFARLWGILWVKLLVGLSLVNHCLHRWVCVWLLVAVLESGAISQGGLNICGSLNVRDSSSFSSTCSVGTWVEAAWAWADDPDAWYQPGAQWMHPLASQFLTLWSTIKASTKNQEIMTAIRKSCMETSWACWNLQAHTEVGNLRRELVPEIEKKINASNVELEFAKVWKVLKALDLFQNVRVTFKLQGNQGNQHHLLNNSALLIHFHCPWF